jgi:hypothetical protein
MIYASGLALQVSWVNDVFRSLLNGLFGLLLSCWWLLDRLGNQLVGYLGVSSYTSEICYA